MTKGKGVEVSVKVKVDGTDIADKAGMVEFVPGTNVTIDIARTPDTDKSPYAQLTINAEDVGGSGHTHVAETKTWAGGEDNTWQLSHAPLGGQAGGMVLMLNGLILAPGTDYTVTEDTITMIATPEADQVSSVFYAYVAGE